jgi:hypothetical protein
MTEPVAFLIALGQALANMGLYSEGHPSRERAIGAAYDALRRLLAGVTAPAFSFIDGEVVYAQRVLPQLDDWEWAPRLAAIGVERLEFVAPVELEEFREVLMDLHRHLKASPLEPLPPRNPATGIRLGRLAFGGEPTAGIAGRLTPTSVPFDLSPEIAGVRWIHERVAESDELPVVEAETIVRSLALTLRREGQVALSLLELAALDEYAVAHACNTAILAMGLTEHLGYPPREVRVMGVAALLHDLGNVRVPREVLATPGPLSTEARRVMQTHPVEGARIILGRHGRMELAAVVAYEHHLDLDGGGYPALLWAREPHFASRLVRVCDVYSAAVSARPWRGPLSHDEALTILQAGAGRAFDPDLVQAFATMLQQAKLSRLNMAHPVAAAEATIEA